MAKTIPDQFTKLKFNFDLVKREGNVVIFKKTQGSWTGYEVMLVGIAKNNVTMGGVITMHKDDEFLPSNAQWGKKGWSYHNITEAEARFNKCLGVTLEEDDGIGADDPDDEEVE
jgi:hypothetical protein